MTAEYPGATWAPIPGFGFPMGAHGGNTPLFIILHGTASGDGTAQQQVAFFQGNNQHGVHFVIGKDGAVFQMVQLADAAYGNCCVDPAPAHAPFWDTILQRFPNLNCCTISIEHCKIAADNSDPLTPAQQDASFKLVAWLCKTLNIPARPADVSGGITGHFSLNGINRVNCPGTYPWQALWSYLTGGKGNNGMLIQHPTQELRLDLVYVGPDGNVYRSHNGGAGGWPSTVENWSNPSKSFAPMTASGTWDVQGQYLNVVAATPDGAIYGATHSFDNSEVVPWQQLAGQSVALPSSAAGPAYDDTAIKARVSVLETLVAKIKAIFA